MTPTLRPATLLLLLLSPNLVFASTEAFENCISLWQEMARGDQRSAYIVDEVIPGLKPLERVIELDRSQPEFTQTFAGYFNLRVNDRRINRGRELLKNYRSDLAEITRTYGIPGQYLMAFWGLETNYGGYLGKVPILDALATLACDTRRTTFFTQELMQALYLVEHEGLDPAKLKGSWAGAVGHTQFMPSTYMRHAVDGDGDGVINLLESEKDALASGANLLKTLGWTRGQRWGREVLLPENFPYAEAGRSNVQALSYWARLGVRRHDGSALPVDDMKGSIIIPDGHRGPAFLVYSNFNVIMGWNRSEKYALAVGRLADRINGAGRLVRPPLTDAPALTRSNVKQMQNRLKEMGITVSVDGILGPGTRDALRQYQTGEGLIADGYPSAETLKKLGITPAS